MIDSSQDVESTARNWVWVPNENSVFKKGHIIENLDDNKVKVKFENNTVCILQLIIRHMILTNG